MSSNGFAGLPTFAGIILNDVICLEGHNKDQNNDNEITDALCYINSTGSVLEIIRLNYETSIAVSFPVPVHS